MRRPVPCGGEHWNTRMNLEPTDAEAQLRAEVREWLREHLPWEYGKGLPPRFDDLADEVAFGRDWQAQAGRRPLGRRGLARGVRRPRRRRGRALHRHRGARPRPGARARRPHRRQPRRARRCSPTARPSRSAQWLPRILAGARDLVPAVQRARRRAATSPSLTHARRGAPTAAGVLNGQKVWTSYAQFADWGVCLARTDPDAPKPRASRTSSIDMRAPGVEVRPLRQITDESEFNEVFFSDVFVPDDRLIGPERRGLAGRELHAHRTSGASTPASS